MTERIQEFLRNRRSEGQDTEPCLVVDLEVVRDNYQTFAKALPDSRQGMKDRGSLETRTQMSLLKRPASLSRDAAEGLSTPCNRDWQPEANRRTPLSTGDAT